MGWAAGPFVAVLAALSVYGGVRLVHDVRMWRATSQGATREQPPEELLKDAYRQALRSVDDSAWLAAEDVVTGTLSALQSRWELVSRRTPPASYPHDRPNRQGVEKPRFIGRATTPPAALDLLAQARAGLDEAATRADPNERFATAHLAALRAAAAVLAARGRPEPSPGQKRARIRSAWEVLPDVAPELAEWSALFAAGARRRARAEAGITGAATQRDADDLVRDASMFLRLVERMLPQLPVTDLLELTENQDTGAAVRHLSHGFDELFKALGPPPPGLNQRQSVAGGGGGTAR